MAAAPMPMAQNTFVIDALPLIVGLAGLTLRAFLSLAVYLAIIAVSLLLKQALNTGLMVTKFSVTDALINPVLVISSRIKHLKALIGITGFENNILLFVLSFYTGSPSLQLMN